MPDFPIHQTYPVAEGDFSRAGEASVAVKKLLKSIDYNPEVVRRVAIAMYEGEINMVIHARGGEATVDVFEDRVEILLADRGPGIPDIEKAVSHGFSTADDRVRSLGFGAGMGLPNIQKYTDEMRIETALGVGTKLYMTIRNHES